jgi:hypothetical protein
MTPLPIASPPPAAGLSSPARRLFLLADRVAGGDIPLSAATFGQQMKRQRAKGNDDIEFIM